MALSSDALKCKKSFLEDNQLFSEIELAAGSKSIGKLQDFDLIENDVWLLQCPKGMDVGELQTQKLKIPGRTNINSSEAVSVEFNEGSVQRAFAYCNRKARYALRLLPVRGTIIVRDRLKAATTVTEERVEECCPPAKRVPIPANIRVRHPLLGAQYESKTDLHKSIAERLQKADKVSAEILKESFIRKSKTELGSHFEIPYSKEGNVTSPIEINSADDDVEFVNEEKLKKKKNKREHKQSNSDVQSCGDTSKIKKKKSNKSILNEELVSKDLQWLKNI